MKKALQNVDLHKYDKDPIPDDINGIEAEIKRMKGLKNDTFLSPIEHQLIVDRIIACEDKIKEIRSAKIKITPVLRTSTIGEKRQNGTRSSYSITESKMLI